ncbi:MAG: class I SAM-dependent methyltransferase [Ardenticatenaceae bacterium]|nr:class I SAM-dependent methyltransferase [Ardenticatenaceae bacterium]MCB9444781.1 class I SAM-dependent methyltransferase [Ardenticatenaceae bacterium]
MSTNKNDLAQSWSLIAPDFDQIGPPFFAQTGRQLVESTEVRTGDRILDAAAGRGAVLFAAAEKVGSNGRIVGIDLAEGMLRNTAVDLRTAHQPVSLAQMDAEHLAFADAAFDVVLCGHAIFYFPPAIQEFRRVLRPGGKIGLTIVAAGTFDWLWQLFAAYQPIEEPAGEEEPVINTRKGLKWRLELAGLEQIRVWEETAVYIYTDEETWWQNLWALGTRHTLETMKPAQQQQFKQDLFQKLQMFRQPDGVHIPISTLFATALKPEALPNE